MLMAHSRTEKPGDVCTYLLNALFELIKVE